MDEIRVNTIINRLAAVPASRVCALLQAYIGGVGSDFTAA